MAYRADPIQWPYSRWSPINMPIGAGATFEGPTTGATNTLHNAWTSYGGNINMDAWSVPVYVADGTYTSVNVTVGNVYTGESSPIAWKHKSGVTIGSAGADGNSVIVWSGYSGPNSGAGGVYWLDMYAYDDGAGTADDAAIYDFVTGNGFGTQEEDRVGMRASGASTPIGLIRKSEIAAGVIPHALTCAVDLRAMSPNIVQAGATEPYVWPAWSADWAWATGYTGGTNGIHIGSLFAIPNTVDITTLGLNPSQLIIARAMQNYGVYVLDTTQSDGIVFYMEPGISTTVQGDAIAALGTLIAKLQRVTNNTPTSIGGGGTPINGLAYADPTHAVDLAAPNPNGNITGGGGANTPPSLTPSAVDFGSVSVGQTTAGWLMTIRNNTTAAITITSTTAPGGPYAVSTPTLVGVSIPAGGFVQRLITFAPTTVGRFNATWTVVAGGVTLTSTLTGLGVNVTPQTPGQVTDSSEIANHPGANVADGNALTYWESNPANTEWLQYDLGATLPVVAVDVTLPAGRSNGYKLQWSTNGTSWTDFYTGAGSNTATTTHHDTSTFSARYIRFQGVTRFASGVGHALYEMVVQTTTGAPMLGQITSGGATSVFKDDLLKAMTGQTVSNPLLNSVTLYAGLVSVLPDATTQSGEYSGSGYARIPISGKFGGPSANIVTDTAQLVWAALSTSITPKGVVFYTALTGGKALLYAAIPGTIVIGAGVQPTLDIGSLQFGVL